jgi:hypothetical protein
VGGVPEDRGGGDAGGTDRRVGGQQPCRPRVPAFNARRQELLDMCGQAERAGVDLSLQLRPAREPVLAGEGKLRRRQGHRRPFPPVQVPVDPGKRGHITGSGRITQLLGLAAELVKAGTIRQRQDGHAISSRRAPGPRVEA